MGLTNPQIFSPNRIDRFVEQLGQATLMRQEKARPKNCSICGPAETQGPHYPPVSPPIWQAIRIDPVSSQLGASVD